MKLDKFITVAIDGGAGSGKSTTSRLLAEKLNFMHVDTGSHYRVLSHFLIENNISPDKTINFINLNKFIGGDKISIETYDDHRFAMSFSILGSHDLFKNQKPWIQIIDPMCCTKTFPLFYQELDKCRLNAE